MDNRNFVTFNADFQDDSVWDEHGNALLPEGRAVAECLCKQLRDKGFFCSEVFQHQFYGWAFDVAYGNSKVWCLLQPGDAWLVLLEPKFSVIERLFFSTNSDGFRIIQDAVHDTFSGNKRFSDVLWYTKKDYESGIKERGFQVPR